MKFEFDPNKSEANKAKHGIDFEEAQVLWTGPVLEVSARSESEDRKLVIGMIGERVWSAIVTIRGDSVRIISVRRARDEERKAYEKHCHD